MKNILADFSYWVESDNVYCMGSKYKTQCTQGKKEFTYLELLKYSVREFLEEKFTEKELLDEILLEATEGVKFTAPQRRIVDRLLRGDKIIVVNQHRANGGEMMWISNEENLDTIRYAGSVYKAFFGVAHSIKKQKEIDFHIGELFIAQIRNVKYGN